MLGIDHDAGVTRGTAGGVDTDGIVEASAYEAIGIVVAQILLRGEGDLTEIFQ